MSEVSWLLVTAAVVLALRAVVGARWRDRTAVLTIVLAACAHVALVDRVSNDDLSDALHVAEIRTDGSYALQIEAEQLLDADLDVTEVVERNGTTLLRVSRVVWGLTTASACVGTRERLDRRGELTFVLPRRECDAASGGAAGGRQG